MHGSKFMVDTICGKNVAAEVLTFHSTGSAVYHIANPSDDKVMVIRAPVQRSSFDDAEAAYLVKYILETAAIPADDICETVLFLDDHQQARTFIPSGEYRGDLDMEACAERLIEVSGNGSYCLYDAYGTLDARIPADALTLIPHTTRGVTARWHPAWLAESVLDMGRETARRTARRWLLQRLARLGFKMDSDYGMREHPDVFVANLRAMSFGMLEPFLSAGEIREMMEMTADIRVETISVGAREADAAKIVFDALGEDNRCLELYRKLENQHQQTDDIWRIWKHVANMSRTPFNSPQPDENNVTDPMDAALTEALGEALGVKPAMESYAKGVPIADIVA